MLRRVVQHPHCHLAAQQPSLLVPLCVCHSHSRHGYPAVSLRRRQWNSLLALPQRVEARTSVRLAVHPFPSPPLPPTLRESSTSMLFHFVCPLHTPLSVQASSSPLKVCVYFVCAVRSQGSSDLTTLVQIMCATFVDYCPVYSKPAAQPPSQQWSHPPPRPAIPYHQPPTTAYPSYTQQQQQPQRPPVQPAYPGGGGERE